MRCRHCKEDKESTEMVRNADLCKRCACAITKKHYYKHLGRKRVQARDYYRNNIEKYRELARRSKRRNRDAINLRQKAARRTLAGYAKCLWFSMKTRVRVDKGYQHRKIHFSKSQFLDWLLNNEGYLRLFLIWKAGDFPIKFSPTIDRVDNYRGYSFDNIQILTKSENARKRNKPYNIGV